MLLAIIAVQQEIVEADLSLDRVMEVVVRCAARLTHADAAVVQVHEGDSMVYRAGWGSAANFLGLRLSTENSLSGLCVRLDETLRSDDTEEDERVDREACRRVGARSMVVTPLRYRGTPMGVLKVYSSRVAAFDEVSAAALRLLVGIIAASMGKAREHEGVTLRALLDPLTGLSNRERLRGAVEIAIAAEKPFALVFLDVNDFKRINDEHGHAAGDAVLQRIAGRLRSSIRDHDLAARLGGDEFVVLLDGIRGETEALQAVRRLQLEIQELDISASAGFALHPMHGQSVETLLAHADAAMYGGKRVRR